MTYQAKNNAYSTLAGSLTNIATSLTVQTGHGDRFPIIAAPDYTIITLEDASGNREVIKVSARAGAADVMTIVRAQEGTTARSWAAGDSVELRMTAGQVQDLFNHIGDEVGAHSANNITNVPSGNLAATDVQGALNELQTDLDTREKSINAATAKVTPVDADLLGVIDSADTNILKKATWANIKATLKAYFDTLYLTISDATTALALKANLASPTLTGTPAAPTATLGTNTTQLATTAFVKAAVDAIPAQPDSSETVKGIVELATDAEAKAGTANKFIDGAKLRSGLNASGSAPVYACRAWVNFNGTGTVAIRASGNVSSISDNGTGNYTVNLTTAMPDANYSVEASVSRDVAFLVSSAIASLTSSSFVVESLRESNTGPTAQDPTYVTAAVFR